MPTSDKTTEDHGEDHPEEKTEREIKASTDLWKSGFDSKYVFRVSFTPTEGYDTAEEAEKAAAKIAKRANEAAVPNWKN